MRPAEVFSGVIQPQQTKKAHFLIQPGWQNSGPHHWQTLWEAQLGHAANRVPQQDWMVPERIAWTGVLEQTIRRTAPPVVILAHSIGCMATIFAIQAAPVAAVVLVAPADAERRERAGSAPHLHSDSNGTSRIRQLCWWPATATRTAAWIAREPLPGHGRRTWKSSPEEGTLTPMQASARGRMAG